MNVRKLGLIVILLAVLLPLPVLAGEFSWMPGLNARADADPVHFRATLATRFNIGDAQINMVLSNVRAPADAYMVFRLGEMSAQPADYVLQQYRSGKGKGWGKLAKSLGIKPGSSEFHALKRGHDLWGYDGPGNGKGKGKGKKKG